MRRWQVLTRYLHLQLGEGDVTSAAIDLLTQISGSQMEQVILTIALAAKYLGKKQDDPLVISAINVLCNQKVGALKPQARMLIDERFENIPDDLWNAFLKTGQLADPVSGLAFEEPLLHVFPSFVAEPKWLRQELPA